MPAPTPVPAFRFQPDGVNLTPVSALAAALFFSAPAFAQGQPGEDSSSTRWSLGIGAISRQQAYAGIDRDNMVLPVLQFENRYVSLAGPQVGLKLPGLNIGDSQRLNFSLVARYDGSGYKAKDAPILNGMNERKAGFLAGAEVEWDNDVVEVKAAWLADVSGNSKGQMFSLGLEKTWRIGRHVMLSPRVKAIWHDKKYVDYYFGVREGEARQNRPAYAGKAGAQAELGLRGLYLFDQRQALFVDVAVSSLAKGVKDSPLVNRSTENRVLMGYTYRFR